MRLDKKFKGSTVYYLIRTGLSYNHVYCISLAVFVAMAWLIMILRLDGDLTDVVISASVIAGIASIIVFSFSKFFIGIERPVPLEFYITSDAVVAHRRAEDDFPADNFPVPKSRIRMLAVRNSKFAEHSAPAGKRRHPLYTNSSRKSRPLERLLTGDSTEFVDTWQVDLETDDLIVQLVSGLNLVTAEKLAADICEDAGLIAERLPRSERYAAAWGITGTNA